MRGASAIRLDKLLPQVGLAESVSDATRKLKAGSVQIGPPGSILEPGRQQR